MTERFMKMMDQTGLLQEIARRRNLANEMTNAATSFSYHSVVRRAIGNKIYLTKDEELNMTENEIHSGEVIRLDIKRWASAEDIDKWRCLHYFSLLHPSTLLLSLCSVLETLGINNKIDGKKMKITFTREIRPTFLSEEESKRPPSD